ncbi:MAG: hypothetical protein V3U73_04310, partial [bacterium]
ALCPLWFHLFYPIFLRQSPGCVNHIARHYYSTDDLEEALCDLYRTFQSVSLAIFTSVLKNILAAICIPKKFHVYNCRHL